MTNFKRCATAVALTMAALPAAADSHMMAPETVIINVAGTDLFYRVPFETAADLCVVTDEVMAIVLEDANVVYCTIDEMMATNANLAQFEQIDEDDEDPVFIDEDLDDDGILDGDDDDVDGDGILDEEDDDIDGDGVLDADDDDVIGGDMDGDDNDGEDTEGEETDGEETDGEDDGTEVEGEVEGDVEVEGEATTGG